MRMPGMLTYVLLSGMLQAQIKNITVRPCVA